ncbi:MAG: hybrid sensor histidine kinase/response regulator [Chthoniobacterales bacterium]
MASIIAQPSSASSRRKRAADPAGRLLALIARLTKPANRPAAAEALARHAGAEHLLVFVPDRDLGILLPAPGFPQTLPNAKRWQAFLANCTTDSFPRADLPFPDEASTSNATALAAEDGSVIVFLGGEHDLETMIDISLLLPMIAAAFEGERTAAVAEGNTAVAKQAATQAKLLAASLENAREELRHTLADARRANAAKDRFLAVLSHELRTPLNPVLMAASAMETDPTIPPEIRADISMIRRNVELEARLIDDLLDLTRISNGKIQLHRKVIDTHELLEQATVVVRGDLSGSCANISLNLTATNSCIDGDPARIQQVFWNLIRNGVKFTPLNGKITVRTENAENGGRLRIVVEDTGIGIEAEALPKIFNAFEQGDTDINRVYGGLGLGLAITKVLVELHGGSLRAESEGVNKGAAFILEFDTVSREAPVNGEPAPSITRTSAARRILLVEDHATTAALMARLLRKRGHEVQLAETKASALSLAQENSFDLVISDLGLPDGNGYEVMEALRARSSVIGIALTGYGMEADIERSVAAGFRFHLTKPVDAQKLFSTIEQIFDAI